MSSFLFWIDSFLEKSVKILLVVSFSSIIFLSLSGMIVRFLEMSIFWIDPLSRHLVFLCAFLGGFLASKKGAHISIDLLGRFFEREGFLKSFYILKMLIHFLSFIALLALTWSAYQFFKVELEFGKKVFFNLHSSVLVFIIPLGFFLLAFSSFVSLFKEGRNE